MRLAHARGRIGPEIPHPDLGEAVIGQEARHGAFAEAAIAVIDHLHVAHLALPGGAEPRQPGAAQEAHVPHDHDEGEIVEIHQQRELQMQEYGTGEQEGPRAPLPDQERIGDLDQDRAVGRDIDQPVVRCQEVEDHAVVVVDVGEDEPDGVALPPVVTFQLVGGAEEE